MKKYILPILFLVSFLLAEAKPLSIERSIETIEKRGYFNFTYTESNGTILLEVPEEKGEFLYVNYLSSGLGSNDIGLDRGQIGNSRVVEFVKYGNKLFLVEKNLDYRAISENRNEQQSVEEAFASSVLHSFSIVKSVGKTHTIEISSMLLSDSHGVSETLKKSKEGSYKVDKSRSAILPEFCKSFPMNTEFRSMITFGGNPIGRKLRTVVPTAESITLRMHHSFVKLPDDRYKPRKFHPESGYFVRRYKDYAVPIEADMTQRFITRHRLEKTADGKTKEPIVYYIDRGCPEPIKSALMEGASWWNQAYEAAGFVDAFQVKELPADADPMDVRYNMIQWVHRSTRGWSYGASVVDPRTGEIIKGHVSLGSLRVRQDYLIMQALMSPYDGSNDFSEENPMTEIALARLRQLSAHEVGHTIGLAHNFAASVNNRASVMDYPHPKIKWTGSGIDFSEAYDDKIGEWDKQAIKYGYCIFDVEEEMELLKIIEENHKKGLSYISDSDARPMSGAHAEAHLWDNGSNICDELNSIYSIRKYSLDKFGQNTIEKGVPYSELEKYIVPLYMMHRYQIEGVSKLIGGQFYTYEVKNDKKFRGTKKVSYEKQLEALESILMTLESDFLFHPAMELIPPTAQGFNKTRESAEGNMGPIYDPQALAGASAKHTFQLLLTPERLNRIASDKMWGSNPTEKYLQKIYSKIYSNSDQHDLLMELFVDYLISGYESRSTHSKVKKEIFKELDNILNKENTSGYQKNKINLFIQGKHSGELLFKSISIPPGSPIGCTH